MKTIILTQRISFIDEVKETRDALDHRLIQWVIASGYMPFPVPNTFIRWDKYNNRSSETVIERWLHSVQPRAILLSGGNDIGEYTERDETERYLLSWAKTYKLPVLGICHGLQIIGVWSGTSLVKVDGHVKTRHNLKSHGSNYDWPESVNSYHDWALSECPDEFRVLAHSEDGSIEAICHNELPWEGWMWHPERETPFAFQDMKRLKALFGD